MTKTADPQTASKIYAISVSPRIETLKALFRS